MSETQWGQIALLATTIAGFVVAEYRASRNRRWANEDRARNMADAIAERKAATAEIIARAAAEAEATRIRQEVIAASLKTHTARTAAALREEARIAADLLVAEAAQIARELQGVTANVAEEQRRTAADLSAKVEEATAAAKDAFTEANHVNLKIADLNQRLVAEGVARAKSDALNGTAAAEKIEKIDQTTERIEERVTEQANKKP